MAKALFISREDLVSKTVLGGNVDSDKFLQFVETAQETHIQNYLGTDLFDKISADINAGTLTGDYRSLVEEYIKPMVIHWAMVEYLPFAAYTVGNGGVYKHTSENSTSVEKEELDFLIEKERKIARSYSERFVDFMQYQGATKFPEYYTNTNEDVHPEKQNNYSSWLL